VLYRDLLGSVCARIATTGSSLRIPAISSASTAATTSGTRLMERRSPPKSMVSISDIGTFPSIVTN
jgi:hypothetical protein